MSRNLFLDFLTRLEFTCNQNLPGLALKFEIAHNLSDCKPKVAVLIFPPFPASELSFVLTFPAIESSTPRPQAIACKYLRCVEIVFLSHGLSDLAHWSLLIKPKFLQSRFLSKPLALSNSFRALILHFRKI